MKLDLTMMENPNLSSQGFMLRPLLRRWSENLVAAGHVSPGLSVVNFNLFIAGIIGKLFVAKFQMR